MGQTVTPYLLYEDAEAAIEFLTRAFGFRETARTTGQAGGLHAELDVGDGSQVFVGQPPSGYRGPAIAGQTSLVYVLTASDADAARRAGTRRGRPHRRGAERHGVRPAALRRRGPAGPPLVLRGAARQLDAQHHRRPGKLWTPIGSFRWC